MTEDNVSDLSVEVLKLIRGDLKEIRGELSGIRAELNGIHGELNGIHSDIAATNARLDQTNSELGFLREETRVGLTGVRQGLVSMGEDMRRLEDEAIAGFTGVRAELDRFVVAASTRFRRLERGPHRPR